MLSRRDRAARNAHILGDLDCLTKTHWQDRLAFYSEKGYPTGSTGTTTNDINRPTERLALMPDTPPAARQARALEIEQALVDLAREYHAIYQWTINAAKYDGPEPRPCVVLDCDREITMIGNDIARNGRCPRCAQHYRRHGVEYPHKTNTPAVA